MLPYVKCYSLEAGGIQSWEKAWESASDCSFVLESGKSGRYSFLGLRPTSTIRGKGNQAEVTHVNEEPIRTKQLLQGDPLSLVKEWMKPYVSPKVKHAPKFVGGCVGFWGYDVVRFIEKLPKTTKDDLPFPDYYFMLMNELWIIDHEEQALYCAVHAHVRSDIEPEL